MLASDTLVVNPHIGLKPVRDGNQITAITLMAPVKGRDLQVTTVERSQDSRLFGVLLMHFVTNGSAGTAGLAEDERSQLTDIGYLVPHDRISTPVWFSCDLENPPADFVPRREPSTSARVTNVLDDLVVNPTLRHFGRNGFPPEMRGRLGLANRFRTDRSWLWVDGTDLCAPGVYSYSAATAAAIDSLAPGEAPPALDPDLRQHLLEAGVIGSSAEMARQRAVRADLQARAGRELHERRYTVLPRVIAPLQLAAARRYYRDLIGEGFLAAGDKDWPDRHFSGRDPIGYFFHQQLTDLVSGIAGQPVKPSFSFFASYRTGSVLPAHRDREQCEYAVSIQLDFSPDPKDVSPWPLHLQPPGSSVAEPVPTALGGAVLYFGREVRHHREVLTEGKYSRHWFFFYVAESFDGPLD